MRRSVLLRHARCARRARDGSAARRRRRRRADRLRRARARATERAHRADAAARRSGARRTGAAPSSGVEDEGVLRGFVQTARAARSRRDGEPNELIVRDLVAEYAGVRSGAARLPARAARSVRTHRRRVAGRRAVARLERSARRQRPPHLAARDASHRRARARRDVPDHRRRSGVRAARRGRGAVRAPRRGRRSVLRSDRRQRGRSVSDRRAPPRATTLRLPTRRCGSGSPTSLRWSPARCGCAISCAGVSPCSSRVAALERIACALDAAQPPRLHDAVLTPVQALDPALHVQSRPSAGPRPRRVLRSDAAVRTSTRSCWSTTARATTRRR